MRWITRFEKTVAIMVFGFILVTFICPGAIAATFYVSSHGSDLKNNGTAGSPFRTIHKALKKIKSGDTVLLLSGVYEEELFNVIPSGISESQNTVITAPEGEQVTIKPRSGYRVITFDKKKYITISNLILDGRNVSNDVVKMDASSFITLKNCKIGNIPGGKKNFVQGILINGKSSHCRIIDSEIYNNGTDPRDHGIYINGDYNLVEHCEIYGNSGCGVHIYNGYSDSELDPIYNTISRCYCHDNGRKDLGRGAGVLVTTGKGNKVINCIITHNVHGIFVNYNSRDAEIYFNTVYGNFRDGILLGSKAYNTVIKNNIFFDNNGGKSDFKTEGAHNIISSNNSIGVDPMFVDLQHAIFLLKENSPCRNKGVDVGTTVDYSGSPRTAQNLDLGALQYVPSNSLASPQNLRLLTATD